MATHSIFLPGEFHGQGSLVGYSPWGYKELDRTERLTFNLLYSSKSLIQPFMYLLMFSRSPTLY